MLILDDRLNINDLVLILSYWIFSLNYLNFNIANILIVFHIIIVIMLIIIFEIHYYLNDFVSNIII